MEHRNPDFLTPSARRKEAMPICGMVFSFHHQILFKGGPNIETEIPASAAPLAVRKERGDVGHDEAKPV